MSPHLRDLLDDAADDGGRPIWLDLGAVRAAGRRAAWRRRALIGGGGLGVAAVITSVAVVLASGGSSAPGFAGDPDPQPTAGQTVQGFTDDQLAASLKPLIDAVAAKGYEIDFKAASGSAGAGSGGGGADTASSVATMLALRHGAQVGSVIVAEFTDLAMLGDGTWDPLDETATNPQCAAVPIDGDSAFAWKTCDLHVDGTEQGTDRWFATGDSPTGEAIGVTMVRPDGSGISVTLSTDPYYATMTGAEDQGLDALPLTHLELVEVVDQLDLNAPLLQTDVTADPDDGQTGTPTAGATATEMPATVEPSVDCPIGEALAEIDDAAGRSALVQSGGRTWYCLVGAVPDSPSDLIDVTDWPSAAELEIWSFGLGYTNMCAKTEPCSGELWYGGGALPDGVVKVTFEMPDGAVVEASTSGEFWIFRHASAAEDFQELPPVIVRAYGADGSVLLEGDVNAPPG